MSAYPLGPSEFKAGLGISAALPNSLDGVVINLVYTDGAYVVYAWRAPQFQVQYGRAKRIDHAYRLYNKAIHHYNQPLKT